MAEAMGISTFRYKLAICSSIAALLARISGWLFAHFQRTVNPTPFGLQGRSNTCSWPCWAGRPRLGRLSRRGAVVMLNEQLQVLLPKLIGTSGNFEIIVFGIVLVVVLKYAPEAARGRCSAALAARRRTRHVPASAPLLPARPRPTPARAAGRGERAQGVRRAGGRQRRQLPDPRRRHRRPDRPQRRRQVAPPST